MIPVAEALDLVLQHCPVLGDETVALDRCVGRTLRQDVVSPHDHPPFDRVMMDGFAVRAADLEGTDHLPLHGEAAAGRPDVEPLRPGHCARAMTGAVLPSGADSVVMVERTSEADGVVRFEGSVRRGQHVAWRGEEARAGQTLLRSGEVITGVGVATIAAAGLATVRVARRPTLAVVSTGDELVPVDADPGPGQIRDTNSWSLAAQAGWEGLARVERLVARDDPADLDAVLGRALESDIVVLSGGVSAGRYDLVPGALESLGVRRVFHQVFQKPGKPLWFGTRGETLVFGTPGNPLATVVSFHLYVRAAIAAMTGQRHDDPEFRGTLTADAAYRGRRDLHVFVRADWAGDGFEVTPLPGRGSADVFAAARANAMLALPAGDHALTAGQEVRFRMLGPHPWR